MDVKTEDGGLFNAAGQGTKALGIIGTVLGGLATAGGLGGILGGGMCGMASKPVVTKECFEWAQAYDNAQIELNKEKSERYADQAVIAGNERFYNFRKDIADAIVDDRTRISSLEKDYSCLSKQLELTQKIYDQKIDSAKNEVLSAVALEAERRCNGDQNVYNWAKSTFVPGKLIIPKTSVCPEPMDRFNSWTAPATVAAPTTQA